MIWWNTAMYHQEKLPHECFASYCLLIDLLTLQLFFSPLLFSRSFCITGNLWLEISPMKQGDQKPIIQYLSISYTTINMTLFVGIMIYKYMVWYINTQLRPWTEKELFRRPGDLATAAGRCVKCNFVWVVRRWWLETCFTYLNIRPYSILDPFCFEAGWKRQIAFCTNRAL